MGKKSKRGLSDRITVIWGNGDITTGDTWREVEDNIRASQWDTYGSREEFRTEMRHRAYMWSGKFPYFAETSKGFVKSLAELGLFLVVEDDELAKTS